MKKEEQIQKLNQDLGLNNNLTVHDSYSRYVQAIPLKDNRAETVAETLVFKVFMVEGISKVLYLDQGTEFKNSFLKKVTKYFRTGQIFTLTNSQWSNLVKQTHRTLGQLTKMLQMKKMRDMDK